jgi:hypothetical protein
VNRREFSIWSSAARLPGRRNGRTHNRPHNNRRPRLETRPHSGRASGPNRVSTPPPTDTRWSEVLDRQSLTALSTNAAISTKAMLGLTP